MEKSFFFKRLMVLVFLCVITISGFTQTIHFIMVIQDAPGSNTDKTNMLAEVDKIGRACNLTVQKYVYNKDQESEYKGKINSITAGNDDVIWFYYSGHGLNSGDGWPAFGNNIKETYIHDKIKAKGARLAITMFDCCNGGQTVGGQRTPTLNPAIAYSLMFKKTRGDIKVCSSSDDLYSFGADDIGGAFTSSFIYAMNNVSLANEEEQKRIWQNIKNVTFQNANALCVQHRWKNRNQRYEQNPKFEINVVTSTTHTSFAPPSLELPYEMSASQLIEYCKQQWPTQKVDIEILKQYNNGGTYNYSGTSKPLFKINGTSTQIPKGQLIWLEKPPTSSGNDW